jgi:Limiting CO2-inducible proteins B/C beta carbonyic anhydrases
LSSSKANPQDPVSKLLTPIGAPVDAQQQMVGNMLMTHAARLASAEDVQAELPYALFDAQTDMINEIISKAAGAVADGKIACLGGIQINTPPDMEDYFEPNRFDIFDNKGNKIDEITL